MQETPNGNKDGLLPMNKLSGDSIISELILVTVDGRSLAQSFVIPLILASFMQSLRKPQGDKC